LVAGRVLQLLSPRIAPNERTWTDRLSPCLLFASRVTRLGEFLPFGRLLKHYKSSPMLAAIFGKNTSFDPK
jgi:hypothetical protein